MVGKEAYSITSPIFVARNNRLFLKLIENAIKAQQKALLTTLSFLSPSYIAILGCYYLELIDLGGGTFQAKMEKENSLIPMPQRKGRESI